MSYAKLLRRVGHPVAVQRAVPRRARERLYEDGVFNTAADYCETYGHDLATGAAITPEEYARQRPAGAGDHQGRRLRAAARGARRRLPVPADDRAACVTTSTPAPRPAARRSSTRPRPDAFVEIAEADAARPGRRRRRRGRGRSRRGQRRGAGPASATSSRASCSCRSTTATWDGDRPRRRRQRADHHAAGTRSASSRTSSTRPWRCRGRRMRPRHARRSMARLRRRSWPSAGSTATPDRAQDGAILTGVAGRAPSRRSPTTSGSSAAHRVASFGTRCPGRRAPRAQLRDRARGHDPGDLVGGPPRLAGAATSRATAARPMRGPRSSAPRSSGARASAPWASSRISPISRRSCSRPAMWTIVCRVRGSSTIQALAGRRVARPRPQPAPARLADDDGRARGTGRDRHRA